MDNSSRNEYADESRSGNAPAFLRSEGEFVYTVRVKRSRRRKANMKSAPHNAKCSRYERCEGCSYASHGFVCWHGDDSCIRTDIEKMTERKE